MKNKILIILIVLSTLFFLVDESKANWTVKSAIHKIIALTSALPKTKINVSPKDSIINGLIGYYTMDGDDVNWTTGKFEDQSASGNDMNQSKLSTTTSPKPGILGQGMSFDGATNLIAIPNPTYSTNISVTISAWIYPYRVNNPDTIMNIGGDAAFGAVHFIFRGTGNLCFDYFGASSITCSTAAGNPITLVPNKWYFLVGTYNESATTMTLYVDGELRQSASVNVNLSAGQMNIGGWTSQSIWFKGIVDEARYYNRVLSASEIKQLYELGRRF